MCTLGLEYLDNKALSGRMERELVFAIPTSTTSLALTNGTSNPSHFALEAMMAFQVHKQGELDRMARDEGERIKFNGLALPSSSGRRRGELAVNQVRQAGRPEQRGTQGCGGGRMGGGLRDHGTAASRQLGTSAMQLQLGMAQPQQDADGNVKTGSDGKAITAKTTKKRKQAMAAAAKRVARQGSGHRVRAIDSVSRYDIMDADLITRVFHWLDFISNRLFLMKQVGSTRPLPD